MCNGSVRGLLGRWTEQRAAAAGALRVRGLPGNVITVADNASVKLKDLEIEGSSRFNAATERSAIIVGKQETVPPLTPSLELEGTRVGFSAGFGVYVNVDWALASAPRLRFVDSSIGGSALTGVFVGPSDLGKEGDEGNNEFANVGSGSAALQIWTVTTGNQAMAIGTPGYR